MMLFSIRCHREYQVLDTGKPKWNAAIVLLASPAFFFQWYICSEKRPLFRFAYVALVVSKLQITVVYWGGGYP